MLYRAADLQHRVRDQIRWNREQRTQKRAKSTSSTVSYSAIFVVVVCILGVVVFVRCSSRRLSNAGHTLCDFSKVSTHTVREDRMRCKAKAHDLCALTIRVKYSGSQLPTLARQISNRSFKTSPIFFLWFIIINIIYYQFIYYQ